MDDELALIEQSIEATRQQMADLSYQVEAGEIDENDWTEEIIALMVAEYLRQYMAGIGTTNLTPEQLAQVQEGASFQSQFIKATGVTLATLSVQEVIRRVAMYANSSRWMYEAGKARGRYGISLPAYPGDGSSQCKSNCKCWWEIIDGEAAILAYWRLGAADHCPTCLDRAGLWNPYIIEA